MLILVRLLKYVHLSTEAGIEDQKQTSEEEQKQYSGGKIKWPFVSKYLNLDYCLNHAIFTIMFHRPNKVKFNITFFLKLTHQK